MSFWGNLNESIANQPPRHSKDVSMYPSEASAIITKYNEPTPIGGCARKSWFRNKQQRVERNKDYQTDKFEIIEQEPLEDSKLWMFRISCKAEDALAEEGRRAGIWANNSQKFEWHIPVEGCPDMIIRGEVDLVFYASPDSYSRYGVEVKTVSGYYGQKQVFGAKSKNGHWLSKPMPKEQNLLQATLYTYLFCNVLNIYQGFKIVYLSRENGNHIEYDLKLFPDASGRHLLYLDGEVYPGMLYAESIIERYASLHKAVINDTLPPREKDIVWSKERLQKAAKAGELTKVQERDLNAGKKVTKTGFCSYCDYRHLCYDDNNNPIDYSNFSDDKDS